MTQKEKEREIAEYADSRIEESINHSSFLDDFSIAENIQPDDTDMEGYLMESE